MRELFASRDAQLGDAAAVSVESPGHRWLVEDAEKQYLLVKVGDRMEAFSSGFLFGLDGGLAGDLAEAAEAVPVPSSLRQGFEDKGTGLSAGARAEVKVEGRAWLITDGSLQYALAKEGSVLAVYRARAAVEAEGEEYWKVSDDRNRYVVLAEGDALGVYSPPTTVAVEDAGRRWFIRDEKGGSKGRRQSCTVARRGESLDVYDGRASWVGPFPVMVAAENDRSKSKIVVMGNGLSLLNWYLTSPVQRPGKEGEVLSDPPPRENADLFINAAYWLSGRSELIAAGPAEVPVIPPIDARGKTVLYSVVLGLALGVLVLGGVMMMIRRR